MNAIMSRFIFLHLFKILDVNNDKMITTDDWQQMADSFIDGHSLAGSAAIAARKALLDWGSLVFELGLDGVEEVLEEQFVRILSNLRQQNPKYAEDLVAEIYQNLTDISDQDQDGFITEKEYLIMNSAFGFGENASREIYNYTGPPEDARGIEKDTIVDFGLEFFEGENEATVQRVVSLIDGVED